LFLNSKSILIKKNLTKCALFFNIWPAGSDQVETDNLIDLQGEEEPQEEAEPQEEGAEPQEEEAEPQEGAEPQEEEGAEGEETADEPPADGDEMGNGDGE
jgi:hypothetical protein